MKKSGKNQDNEINDNRLGSMLSREIAAQEAGTNEPGTCLTPGMISAFVSGKMAETERANCRDHILACPPCRQAVVICGKLQESSKKMIPFSRPLALAASILVAVFAIYLFTYLFTGSETQPFSISHYTIDEPMQHFLLKTNQTVITDKSSIQAVVKMLGKDNKALSAYHNIGELRLKWPTRTSKDISWRPEKINVHIKDNIMTIEILNQPAGLNQ